MKKTIIFLFVLCSSVSAFSQETLQTVTERGNSTSNGIVANGPSSINGILFNLPSTYTKEITPIGYNFNISNGASDGKILIPYTSTNANIRFFNFGLNLDKNLGIGTTNTTAGLQLGDFNNSNITSKQILIPGVYNFEQMRLGQIGNGNMGMEFVNHSGVNNSYGIKWLVNVDEAPGLQIQYASDQNQYDALSYQTGFYMNKIGSIGIGTLNPAYKLDVIGTIRSREVKVDLLGADFVFENDYKLMPIDELEKFIKERKHLPEIVSAKEMEINGVELGKLNSKLLQKTEELTLYIIQQQKEINDLKLMLTSLKKSKKDSNLE